LVLAALQVDSISVAVQQLGAVRRGLAGHSAAKLADLAAPILNQRTALQVRDFLQHLQDA